MSIIRPAPIFDGPFTRKPVCSMPLRGGGRITLSGRTLVVTALGVRRETLLADDAAVEAALAEHFGIRLPRAPAAPAATGGGR